MSTGLPMSTRWRNTLLMLVLLMAFILLLYGRTAWGMAMIWARSDTYAHGFVVPLISLWLAWRQRAVVLALVPAPGAWAWLGMLCAAGLWLAGDLVAVNAVTQLALVAMLVLAVPAVAGWAVARALTFPLGFLFFSVPLGDFMLPQLMEWTADFTVLALRLSGIPVFREGLQFVIPSGNWSVVEACSGIRYMIASLTVGCLFAYLSYSSLRKRWIFMGVALLVPVVANWLRAYLIVMMGHLSGNALATGVDHLIYGWLFFGLIISVMLFIGARWTDASMLIAPAPVGTAGALPTAGPSRGRTSVWALTAAAFVVAWAPHGVEWVLRQGSNPHAVQLAAVPPQAGWSSNDMPLSDWRPAFEHTSADADAVYADAQQHLVGLHLAYYRQQDYERKLVSSENMLVKHNDPRWARVSTGSAHTQLAGEPLAVDTAVLRESGQGLAHTGKRLLAWRFYWVHGRFTSSDSWAKVLGALARIQGRGDDAAIVVVYTPLDPQVLADQAQEAATQTLQAFLAGHGEVLRLALQQTRGQD